MPQANVVVELGPDALHVWQTVFKVSLEHFIKSYGTLASAVNAAMDSADQAVVAYIRKYS
jgi:hypothetical protein